MKIQSKGLNFYFEIMINNFLYLEISLYLSIHPSICLIKIILFYF